MIFKSTIRIPTHEYSYIELEVEAEPDVIIDTYKQFTNLLKPQEGLSEKDFNKFLDQYVTNATGDLETYNLMSEPQKAIIQALKKCFKRIKSKE